MICPKCGGDLQVGIAIKPHIEENTRYIAPQPLINNETLELIPVLKCIKCGYSFINNDNNMEDDIKLTIERRDFNLAPQPKIVDFEIIHEVSDWLAIDMRTVINERLISTLRGKAPRRHRRVRQPSPHFRRTR